MSLINREKLCVNREKSAPKIHHFFTVSFSRLRLLDMLAYIMLKSPESEILAKCFADVSENVAKIWRNISPIFVRLIAGKLAAIYFKRSPQQIPRTMKWNSFTTRLWEHVGTTYSRNVLGQDFHFLLQDPPTPEGFRKGFRRGLWRVFEGF